MKITRKQIRSILTEAFAQDVRHPLDGMPGHMGINISVDIFQDYLLWSRVNGADANSSKNIKLFASENGLELDSLEIQDIKRNLSYG